MKPEGENETFLPDADEFRAWLKVAKQQLQIKPSALSIAADVATNTLGKFESEIHKGREIHLSTATKIYRTALKLAREKVVELPPLELFAKDSEGRDE